MTYGCDDAEKWTLAVVGIEVVVVTTPSVESLVVGRIGYGHDHTELWSSQSATGMPMVMTMLHVCFLSPLQGRLW